MNAKRKLMQNSILNDDIKLFMNTHLPCEKKRCLPESVLIVALNCNFVPRTTAWSTGRSLEISSLFAASRYNATSYSKGPGDSSTTPETRAAYGLS